MRMRMMYSSSASIVATILVCLCRSAFSSSSPSSSSSHGDDATGRSRRPRPRPRRLPTLEDLRVRDLEKIVPAYASFEGKMFAGSLPVDHSNGDGGVKRTGFLQFWLFVPDHPTAPDTMVSWFNGGPGCSSFATGIMFEHGPVTVPLHPAGWCCEAEDEPLQYNPYGWTNATVMLYVEQPMGVGFSEATHGTPPPASENDVAADFDSFLQTFYTIFDGSSSSSSSSVGRGGVDLTSHKLFLVGESYAGIYIPSIARGIYLANKKAITTDDNDGEEGGRRFQTPLAGIAIGNGKMDAITQDPAVIDFAFWHGLIDGPTREYIQNKWDECLTKVDVSDGVIGTTRSASGAVPANSHGDAPFHPFTVRDDCGVLNALLEAAGESAFEKVPSGPNLYEYSTWDSYAAGEGDEGTVGSFYNNLEVQKALNVPKHRQGIHWQGCIPELEIFDDRRRRLSSSAAAPDNNNNTTFSSSSRRLKKQQQQDHPQRKLFMDYDTPWSVVPYVAELLDDAKIDVLIYSGDRDIICCTQGTEETLRKMDWSGTQEPPPGPTTMVNGHHNAWTHATRSLWVYNDTYPAGYIKSYKNLKLLTIYNAGHMVPYNQPGPALDMIHRFVRGDDFHDRPLTTFLSHLDAVKKGTAEEIDPKATVDLLGSERPTLQHQHQVPQKSIPFAPTIILSVALAFLLGYGVARLTPRRRPAALGSEEIVPCGKVYGSMSK